MSSEPATWKSTIFGSSKQLDTATLTTAEILNNRQEVVRQKRHDKLMRQAIPLVNYIIDECYKESDRELGSKYKTFNITALYTDEESGLLAAFKDADSCPKPLHEELYELLEVVIDDLESAHNGFVVGWMEAEVDLIIEIFWETEE